MWHVRNHREKWLCSREQYVINVKGLHCILKTRHKMMTANLDQLWSCKYPKQKRDCILWHSCYSVWEFYTEWKLCCAETSHPLMILRCHGNRGTFIRHCSLWVSQRQVCHWESSTACTSNRNTETERGTWNICIEREKRRDSQLDEGDAEVSVQRTNLFCCCFMQLVGICQARRKGFTWVNNHLRTALLLWFRRENTRYFVCVAAHFYTVFKCNILPQKL